MFQESYQTAKGVILSHKKEFERLADLLFKYETLDEEDIKCAIEGKPILNKKPKEREFRDPKVKKPRDPGLQGGPSQQLMTNGKDLTTNK